MGLAWPRARPCRRPDGAAGPRPGPAFRLGGAAGAGARARQAAVRGAGRPAAAAARRADLGPVRGPALPPRPRAVGRHRPAVPGPVLPPRPLLPGRGADLRRRQWRGAAGRVRSQPVRLRADQVRPALAARSRLRRLAAAFPHQLRAGHRRLPGCVLFPRDGCRQPVRHVLSRPGDRQRDRARRGVPALLAFLAGAAAPDRHGAHRLRAAGEREHHRCLPLRHLAGRRHHHGRDAPGCSRASRSGAWASRR